MDSLGDVDGERLMFVDKSGKIHFYKWGTVSHRRIKDYNGDFQNKV